MRLRHPRERRTVRPCSNGVLMVGFHFPPCSLSSGHLRLLAFSRYLPEFGWNPIILSATGCAYEKMDPSSVSAIPAGIQVHRAFGLDTKRHLGIHGRYLSILARPDRWVSWWPAAVLSGLRLIRKHDVRAIWSTYPIMTAHCVAYSLSRLTGIPWIADFRDPVSSSVAGKDRATVENQLRWERRVISRAACSVFTTPGAARNCGKRYPAARQANQIATIPNGFDEADFNDLRCVAEAGSRLPLHFVHAGTLYPDGRNPLPFFKALANLKRSGAFKDRGIRVTLRASGAENLYAPMLEHQGLADVVTLAPFLPYKESLAEQAAADGLLLFQGREYDHQVPAKLYEYLRLGRPIFALVGEQGDTASVLDSVARSVSAPPDDEAAIATSFAKFVEYIRDGVFASMPVEDIGRFSRRHTAERLAELLDQVSGNRALAGDRAVHEAHS